MSNLPPLGNRRVLTWLRMFSDPLQRAYPETRDAVEEDFAQLLAVGRQAKPDTRNSPAEAENKPGKES